MHATTENLKNIVQTNCLHVHNFVFYNLIEYDKNPRVNTYIYFFVTSLILKRTGTDLIIQNKF